MEIFLANPRGFCAGVDRAIDIVEIVLKKHGSPVYVRHEVVHNKYVVNDLKKKGAIFVEEIADVPPGSVVIFSAHGVSKKVKLQAAKRSLTVYDATCPLVTKVHKEVIRDNDVGMELVMIGHNGHPEVEGTMGQINKKIHLVETVEDVEKLKVDNPDKLSYITQTTLSVDDTFSITEILKHKFPKITGPKKSDICYATQNRQDAVKTLAKKCDVIIIVGSSNSSNSTRLKELATKMNIDSYMIDEVDLFQEKWLKNKEKIGITAGASAPEILVQDIVNKVKSYGVNKITELDGMKEKITFSLPRILVDFN